MASLRPCFFYFMLVSAILLLSPPVICDNAKERSLFQDLNKYRKTKGLPALTRNDKADCLADKIADKLEHLPCTNVNGANTPPSALPKFKDYAKQMSKCNIDEKATINGTILPVCVRKLDSTMVLYNYTLSNHARFLNDSKFTTAGVGSEDDWMVVILLPNASAAGGSTTSSSSAAHLVFEGSVFGYALFFVVGFVHFVGYVLN